MKLSLIAESQDAYIDTEWDADRSYVKFRWVIPGYESPSATDGDLDGVVCSLNLERLPDDYFWVDGVHTDGGYQGLGYATKLYRHALSNLQGAGYKGIKSSHSIRNDNSNALWKKLGGRSDDFYNYLE